MVISSLTSSSSPCLSARRRLIRHATSLERPSFAQVYTSPARLRPACKLETRNAHSRRSFSTTRSLSDFHFDTHHFVQRLEREGLNRAQAEGIMSAMAEVIDESIRNMTANMVTKADQEKQHYTQQVDFAQMKSELQLMEKNDLAMLKAENERLQNDIEKLKQRLREAVTQTQAGVRLDLVLEKGRMRDESSGQVLKIKEVDTRIEQEIANLRTSIQSSKATTLQYLVGFVTGVSALVMAYVRFRL